MGEILDYIVKRGEGNYLCYKTNKVIWGSRNLVGISVYLCHSKQEELFVYYSM